MMHLMKLFTICAVASVALLPSTHAASHVMLKHAIGDGMMLVHDEAVTATKDGLVLISTDGTLTDHVIMEAEKFVGMGYAVGVCDVGAHVVDLKVKANQDNLATKVSDCVAWVKERDGISAKVALVGWGVGGTAVLHCVSADVGAAAGVAYTPDISAPMLPSFEAPKFPIWVAVDYAHYAHLAQFEKVMDFANATVEWEVSMLSDTKMHFNVMGHANYNAAAAMTTAMRSATFLSDAMGTTTYSGGTEQPARTEASLTETHLNYSFGEDMLPGALIYDAAVATADAPKPAVVVVPAWGGYTEYELERQNYFALKGYVTMSANIYGLPLEYVVPTREERGGYVGTYRAENDDTKAELFADKIMAAVTAVKALDFVDSSKVGVIGFCFGGTGVYNMYRTGKDIQAGVSMHGSMVTTRDMSAVNSLNAPGKLLMVSGGEDSGEEGADLTTHLADLSKYDVAWELQRFSQVLHGFSEWGGNSFNARAEGRGFHATDDVYAEAFGMTRPVEVPTAPSTPFMTGAEVTNLANGGTPAPSTTTPSSASSASPSLVLLALVSAAVAALRL